jgi:hypothetical protein
MGTSKSYSAPPSWSGLKGEVTRAAGAGVPTPAKTGQLLRNFISNNGGARAMSRGTRGGTVASGRAARAVAGRLGSFISDIGRVGFEDALRKAGWADLAGRPAQEILSSLLDRLGGRSNTIDDVDARMALSKIQDEYFAAATTTEELEQMLINQVDRVDALLQDFFGYYLYEVFCRVFFERLVQRVGETQAFSFLKEIGDFIRSTLANRAARQDLSRIDWSSREGQAMISDIMETTLDVFGG